MWGVTEMPRQIIQDIEIKNTYIGELASQIREIPKAKSRENRNS